MQLCTESDDIHVTTLTTNANYKFFRYYGILFFNNFYTHTNLTKSVVIRHHHNNEEEKSSEIYVPPVTTLDTFLSADSSAYQEVKKINHTKLKRRMEEINTQVLVVIVVVVVVVVVVVLVVIVVVVVVVVLECL